MIFKNFVFLLIGVVVMISGKTLYASDNSFQIAPPPIAYPHFEAGKTDGKIEPLFINIESQQAEMSLSGAGLNFVGRQAFSELIAFDMQGGIFALTGQMPGIPPMTLIPTSGAYGGYYYTRVDGKADVSMASFLISFNIEMQLIKEDEGNLIFFFGPNLGLANMTMMTPYSLIVPLPYSNAGEVYSGYTDTLTISSNTAGIQFGMQAGLSLGNGLNLSPFFMISSTSGTAMMQDDPGTGNTEPSTMTADMPESTTTSFGMDIIIDDLSIGTILQNIKSQEQDENSDIEIIMFRLGYHF